MFSLVLMLHLPSSVSLRSRVGCGDLKYTPSVAIMSKSDVPLGCVAIAIRIEARQWAVINDADKGFEYFGEPIDCACFPYRLFRISLIAFPALDSFPASRRCW